jgi:putative molybdopterin biosynthesis protein
MFEPHLRVPDLIIMGSHCIGLEPIIDALTDQGLRVRIVAIGSMGGLAAVKRGDCDIAPMHLLDPHTGLYNRPLLSPELTLIEGWKRMQGIVFRPGDRRFEGKSVEAAIADALSDPECHMVNRNDGSGTRSLIERLLAKSRPPGYLIQPKSHNAVAAAVAQKRADWGIAIAPVAKDYGLGFIPVAQEHYDFAVRLERLTRPGVAAFIAALQGETLRATLATAFSFEPACFP